ncbi:MAG TPA: lysophospholipid acyltransferase family protein [Bryobacteraceae bacterium]|nr:lysophospholipid acyltransferase family protein [Bryobacteraceae bacterium]
MLATPGSGISPNEAPRIARQLVSSAMFRLLDDVVVARPAFLKELRVAEVSGLEYLDAGVAHGKGVVIVIGHFSAVRISRRYLATLGYRILAVRGYQPAAGGAGRLSGRWVQPRLAKFMRAVIRDEVDSRSPDCTLQILRRLRSGGLVSMTLDAPGGSRRVEVSLLGTPSRFSTGLLDIIRLSGCSVVPMLCLGRSSDLRIVFSPPLDIVPCASRDEFIDRNLPTFVKCLEKQIADHPAEWVLWSLL